MLGTGADFKDCLRPFNPLPQGHHTTSTIKHSGLGISEVLIGAFPRWSMTLAMVGWVCGRSRAISTRVIDLWHGSCHRCGDCCLKHNSIKLGWWRWWWYRCFLTVVSPRIPTRRHPSTIDWKDKDKNFIEWKMYVSHELNRYSSTTDDSMSLKIEEWKLFVRLKVWNKYMVSQRPFKVWTNYLT